MQTVLTIVAHPPTRPLARQDVDTLAAALTGAGHAVMRSDILAPDEAVDLYVAGEPAAVEPLARGALGGLPVDLAVQAPEGRQKALLVADMDSTMITVECIDELADFAGLKTQVAAITERAMRGEIEFEGALRERVALLKGLPREVLARVYEERVQLQGGARRLVQTMRAHGAHTALVSGGFTYFTGRVRADCGFDFDLSNQLVFGSDGRLTGEVAEPIIGREAKLATLVQLREERAIAPHATLAVGDGSNDLAMIGAAGLGVAYHAKPIVAERAHARVDHGDLTALLYFQGIPAHRHVTD